MDSTVEALRPADGDVGPGPPPETPEKVKVHFKPIANAPILRKTKFFVLSSWTCAELRTSLRNQLQLSDSTPLVRRVCTTYRQPSIYELSAISQYVHVLMPQGNNHSGGHSPPSSLLS
ncbi:unnamed protein product [Sphacelaria rigidula]